MANTKPIPASPLRLLILGIILVLLVLGIVGALVTLFAPSDRAMLPEASKNTPQARQLERDSLRQEVRSPGS